MAIENMKAEGIRWVLGERVAAAGRSWLIHAVASRPNGSHGKLTLG